jgi:tyrosyl-tRNA synthetase
VTTNFLDEMAWRGQLAQLTAADAQFREHLSTPRKAYVGFDPTADSLTIGNLVGIMALARWQRCGHSPVVVMGGGTGLIGDPSGKSAERQLHTRETVAGNVEKIRSIFDRLLDFSPESPHRAVIVNNIDWLGNLGYLDALRDIGKHFSVNMMIQKDSVKERLTNRDQGISYTEFSYMILQAYDFAFLREHHGVSVQMGGSDQFGNIVVGKDLIDKRAAALGPAPAESFGLTWPLVTKADGGKFGKTESGAIWLSPHRTSPFAYYQFWLNTADADAVKFLRTFTFLTQSEIASLEASLTANPGAREAQRALARQATKILHGDAEMHAAENAAAALFSGEIAGLPLHVLNEALASAPSSTHARSKLGGPGAALIDVLVETGLAASKREAKEFAQTGSVSVNGVKAAPDKVLASSDLLHGSVIALRRGKKHWHVMRFA